MARTRAALSPLLAILCLAVAVPVKPFRPQDPQPATRASSLPAAFIDVVVASRDPRPAGILGPQDFTVTVDGRPRSVLAVRHVSRGPGAASAAGARQAGGGVTFGAEPARTVLVAIDQSMLRRGDERSVIQAAGALLDRLGLDDRVAIVRLPLTSTTPIAFTTDRPGARDGLRAVAGQFVPGGGVAADEKTKAANAERTVAGDPDRAAAGDPDRANPPEQLVPRDPAMPLPSPEVERAGATLAGLENLLKGLQPLPGRKTVVLFSAGLPPTASAQTSPIDALAGAAVASRAVLYTFGLRAAQVDDRQAADFSLVEALAKRTGGAFAMLERDATRTVERIVPDLSTCYVLRVEALPADADGRPHALRVATSKAGFTVRAPAFLVARSDLEDEITSEPPVDAPIAPAPPAAETRRDSRAAARDADLQLALSRLGEYVEAYQREFSAVVAEESYLQTEGVLQRRLRSDFLLVRPENSDAWVSFRDVFEVDGTPVRDRDERLKRLFLDNPMAEAILRVQAVQDESARFNIGHVSRNVNVPLFALKVARIGNQARFRFTLGGSGQSQGVATWRIEYEERIRPTLVKNPRTGADVPLKGSFLVDAVTGAIVESRVEANDVDLTGRFVVRFRRDPVLGLWVPGEMTEIYEILPAATYSALVSRAAVTMQGRATYSNFRRFQVKTEEKITIPK